MKTRGRKAVGHVQEVETRVSSRGRVVKPARRHEHTLPLVAPSSSNSEQQNDARKSRRRGRLAKKGASAAASIGVKNAPGRSGRKEYPLRRPTTTRNKVGRPVGSVKRVKKELPKVENDEDSSSETETSDVNNESDSDTIDEEEVNTDNLTVTDLGEHNSSKSGEGASTEKVQLSAFSCAEQAEPEITKIGKERPVNSFPNEAKLISSKEIVGDGKSPSISVEEDRVEERLKPVSGDRNTGRVDVTKMSSASGKETAANDVLKRAGTEAAKSVPEVKGSLADTIDNLIRMELIGKQDGGRSGSGGHNHQSRSGDTPDGSGKDSDKETNSNHTGSPISLNTPSEGQGQASNNCKSPQTGHGSNSGDVTSTAGASASATVTRTSSTASFDSSEDDNVDYKCPKKKFLKKMKIQNTTTSGGNASGSQIKLQNNSSTAPSSGGNDISVLAPPKRSGVNSDSPAALPADRTSDNAWSKRAPSDNTVKPPPPLNIRTYIDQIMDSKDIRDCLMSTGDGERKDSTLQVLNSQAMEPPVSIGQNRPVVGDMRSRSGSGSLPGEMRPRTGVPRGECYGGTGVTNSGGSREGRPRAGSATLPADMHPSLSHAGTFPPGGILARAIQTSSAAVIQAGPGPELRMSPVEMRQRAGTIYSAPGGVKHCNDQQSPHYRAEGIHRESADYEPAVKRRATSPQGGSNGSRGMDQRGRPLVGERTSEFTARVSPMVGPSQQVRMDIPPHLMVGGQRQPIMMYPPAARGPSITAGTGQPRPPQPSQPRGHSTYRGQKPVQPVHPAQIQMRPTHAEPPLKPNYLTRPTSGLIASSNHHAHLAQYEDQGHSQGQSYHQQVQGMLAVVPHHVIQSNPEVLKGQTSPKMAAMDVLDLTKQEDELRLRMQQAMGGGSGGAGGGGGDAPLDLSVKKSQEKSSGEPKQDFISEHQNPNWGPHMVRVQEGSRYSPHIKSLENSLHKHLKGVDAPVFPSDLLNRPPLGVAAGHAGVLHAGLAPGGLAAANAGVGAVTPEQRAAAAALSMRLGMTPEALHMVQQQQMAAAAALAAQHRYEPPHGATAHLQRTPVIGQAHPYVVSNHGRHDHSEDSRHTSPPMRERLSLQARGRAQGLLGNVSPDDILDVTCLLCSETKYGSLHAFRKHFHRVHGCEPTEEHAFVRRISEARKHQDSLHKGYGYSSPAAAHLLLAGPGQQIKREPESPQSTHSGARSPQEGSEAGNSSSTGSGMMRCPHCGQDFPTRDWGAFKRHVKTHDQVNSGHGDPPGMNGHKCPHCLAVIHDYGHLQDHLRQHELRGDLKERSNTGFIPISARHGSTSASPQQQVVRCGSNSSGSTPPHPTPTGAEDSPSSFPSRKQLAQTIRQRLEQVGEEGRRLMHARRSPDTREVPRDMREHGRGEEGDGHRPSLYGQTIAKTLMTIIHDTVEEESRRPSVDIVRDGAMIACQEAAAKRAAEKLRQQNVSSSPTSSSGMMSQNREIQQVEQDYRRELSLGRDVHSLPQLPSSRGAHYALAGPDSGKAVQGQRDIGSLANQVFQRAVEKCLMEELDKERSEQQGKGREADGSPRTASGSSSRQSPSRSLLSQLEVSSHKPDNVENRVFSAIDNMVGEKTPAPVSVVHPEGASTLDKRSNIPGNNGLLSTVKSVTGASGEQRQLPLGVVRPEVVRDDPERRGLKRRFSGTGSETAMVSIDRMIERTVINSYKTQDSEESDRERAADMSLLEKLGVTVNRSNSDHSRTPPSAGDAPKPAGVVVKPLNKEQEDDDDDSSYPILGTQRPGPPSSTMMHGIPIFPLGFRTSSTPTPHLSSTSVPSVGTASNLERTLRGIATASNSSVSSADNTDKTKVPSPPAKTESFENASLSALQKLTNSPLAASTSSSNSSDGSMSGSNSMVSGGGNITTGVGSCSISSCATSSSGSITSGTPVTASGGKNKLVEDMQHMTVSIQQLVNKVVDTKSLQDDDDEEEGDTKAGKTKLLGVLDKMESSGSTPLAVAEPKEENVTESEDKIKSKNSEPRVKEEGEKMKDEVVKSDNDTKMNSEAVKDEEKTSSGSKSYLAYTQGNPGGVPGDSPVTLAARKQYSIDEYDEFSDTEEERDTSGGTTRGSDGEGESVFSPPTTPVRSGGWQTEISAGIPVGMSMATRSPGRAASPKGSLLARATSPRGPIAPPSGTQKPKSPSAKCVQDESGYQTTQDTTPDVLPKKDVGPVDKGSTEKAQSSSDCTSNSIKLSSDSGTVSANSAQSATSGATGKNCTIKDESIKVDNTSTSDKGSKTLTQDKGESQSKNEDQQTKSAVSANCDTKVPETSNSKSDDFSKSSSSYSLNSEKESCDKRVENLTSDDTPVNRNLLQKSATIESAAAKSSIESNSAADDSLAKSSATPNSAKSSVGETLSKSGSKTKCSDIRSQVDGPADSLDLSFTSSDSSDHEGITSSDRTGSGNTSRLLERLKTRALNAQVNGNGRSTEAKTSSKSWRRGKMFKSAEESCTAQAADGAETPVECDSAKTGSNTMSNGSKSLNGDKNEEGDSTVLDTVGKECNCDECETDEDTEEDMSSKTFPLRCPWYSRLLHRASYSAPSSPASAAQPAPTMPGASPATWARAKDDLVLTRQGSRLRRGRQCHDAHVTSCSDVMTHGRRHGRKRRHGAVCTAPRRSKKRLRGCRVNLEDIGKNPDFSRFINSTGEDGQE